ncbi:MAG TPA: DUF2127 domain-containing protein [Mobilitalea sp.]|nr:DUF2127 domain-containing protein [Mobilitalea sp.]
MIEKMNSKQIKAIHVGFQIGLLFKGIDGLLEVIGGISLIFLNQARLNKIIQLVTQGELSEDPRDVVANALLRFGSSFSLDAQSFGVFYLMSHGIIKIIIILLLWRKKLWAYPVSIASLVLFIAYQIYRYTISASPLMILLTIFDIAMIILTYLEYQRMKLKFSTQ